jgi:hypothetical protein
MDKKKTPDDSEGMDLMELLYLMFRAGLTKDDMMFDPEHGLLVSLEGARKMAKLAPDPEDARVVLDQIEESIAVHNAKKQGLH